MQKTSSFVSHRATRWLVTGLLLTAGVATAVQENRAHNQSTQLAHIEAYLVSAHTNLQRQCTEFANALTSNRTIGTFEIEQRLRLCGYSNSATTADGIATRWRSSATRDDARAAAMRVMISNLADGGLPFRDNDATQLPAGYLEKFRPVHSAQ